MPRSPNLEATFRRLWASPESLATTLVALALDNYGSECFDWTPPALRLEIEEDFGLRMPPANFDRLMVGIRLLVSDSFYKSLPDFIETCNVLSGADASPGAFDPATAEEVAWGVTEGVLLSPPPEGEEDPFDVHIIAYIGEVLRQEGILNPPDVLRLAGADQALLSRVSMGFSDDPEMFNAVWDMERSKVEDINSVIKARLGLLIRQLHEIPLANGSAEKIAQRMAQSLTSHSKR